MAKRKVKIEAEEYMLEDDAAGKFEDLMKRHQDLMTAHEALKGEHEKMTAERDSMRDKDHHDPEAVHHPLEEDEIGPKGKEEIDPIDSYGMQSHVRDYEKPSAMKEHVVESPKNNHYPHDLPHVSKVDAAEVNRRVKDRVKLEKLSERFLDKTCLARIDGMSDMEIKKRLIIAIQPKAQIEGKSEGYINARFDAALEDVPQQKVVAFPTSIKSDEDAEKDHADANEARKNMIKRQKVAHKGGK